MSSNHTSENDSSKSSSTGESTPSPKAECYYGSPSSVEVTIRNSESSRYAMLNERISKEKELQGKKSTVDKTKQASEMPIVDLSTFEEYKSLLKSYNDIAKCSEYPAKGSETTFFVICNQDLEHKEIKSVCEKLQKNVQDKFKELMFCIGSRGTPILPQLVYFRTCPAKKVFMKTNMPQLKAIAHKRVIAEKLINDRLSSDFVEKFKQLCFEPENTNAQEKSIIDAKCKEITKEICDIVQEEQNSGSKKIKFKPNVSSRYSAIVRIIQPYQEMEDFLDPALWYMQTSSNSPIILDRTPIFNEGIVYDGSEFHSALFLLSIDTKCCTPTIPSMEAFPVTKIELLARTGTCMKGGCTCRR